MLKKILAVLGLLSLTGNGVLYGMWQHSKAETQTMVSEAAVSANARLTESLSHQAAAFAIREQEMARRLEFSNQVTKEAIARLEDRNAELRAYQDAQDERSSQDASYAVWSDAPLPHGVADSLRKLQ